MRILKVMTILMIPAAVWFNINVYEDYSLKQIPNVHYEDFKSSTRKQIDCLAENIYYEAGSESNEGKIAVAQVTLNRTEHPDFPKTICSVVKQKESGVCQFSWVCEGKNTSHKSREVYEECKRVAILMYINYKTRYNDITGGALYYHADYVNPGWNNLKYIKKIDHHLFYRTKV